MKYIIEDILIYIEENIFLEELKIEDIAAYFGYDKYHLAVSSRRLPDIHYVNIFPVSKLKKQLN